MFGFLSEQPNANLHFLNRLIKLLNQFISIEPEDKPKGFECHHIVPKSWKPEWSKEPDNLLKVPAKAHYVIHHLMWKAFPDSISMCRSFWFFAKKRKITAKVYEKIKNNLKVSDNTRKKMRAAKVGKPLSAEHRKKVGDSQKGKTISEAQKQQISAVHKGKTLSKETRRKISESQIGRVVSPETRRKISESLKNKNSISKSLVDNRLKLDRFSFQPH